MGQFYAFHLDAITAAAVSWGRVYVMWYSGAPLYSPKGRGGWGEGVGERGVKASYTNAVSESHRPNHRGAHRIAGSGVYLK